MNKSFGESLVLFCVVCLTALGTVCVLSLLTGTVVWALWPVAVPSVLPGLVGSGSLPPALAWWNAVCAVWLLATLAGVVRSVRGEAKP